MASAHHQPGIYFMGLIGNHIGWLVAIQYRTPHTDSCLFGVRNRLFYCHTRGLELNIVVSAINH